MTRSWAVPARFVTSAAAHAHASCRHFFVTFRQGNCRAAAPKIQLTGLGKTAFSSVCGRQSTHDAGDLTVILCKPIARNAMTLSFDPIRFTAEGHFIGGRLADHSTYAWRRFTRDLSPTIRMTRRLQAAWVNRYGRSRAYPADRWLQAVRHRQGSRPRSLSRQPQEQERAY